MSSDRAHATKSQDSDEKRTSPDTNKVVRRNIRDILDGRKRIERRQTQSERLAGSITRAAGSMWFAYFHVGWFGLWIAYNVSRGDAAFDPFPFVLLTTVVSLEAIFLTLMVLVSQNRESKLEEQRADLDLQIDLLAEYEVTQLLCLMVAVARKIDVGEECQLNLGDLETEVRPRDLLKELERFERRHNGSH
jgi:uncharacterized membrane protein